MYHRISLTTNGTILQITEYSEAQEFDQLRAIMRSLGSNAFLGFHEAAIDFPPTFKYDVLRTLKGGKRSSSKRRSRRKKKKDLTEVGEEAEDPDYAPQSAVTQEDGEGPLESASMISRSTSYYSRNTREQGDGSYGSDSDSDSDRSGEKNINGDKDSGIAQKARIGVVYAALKAKEKLHAAFGSTGSLPNAPNSTHLVKGIQLQAPPLPIIKADVVRSPSRNTALSARKSAEVSSPSAAAIPKEPYKDPPKSGLVTPSVSRKTTSLDIPRKPSHDSQSNAQLARSIAAKSPSVSKTTLTLHEVKDAEQSLDIEDKGVYDTSSKQRVPSWSVSLLRPIVRVLIYKRSLICIGVIESCSRQLSKFHQRQLRKNPHLSNYLYHLDDRPLRWLDFSIRLNINNGKIRLPPLQRDRPPSPQLLWNLAKEGLATRLNERKEERTAS